MMTILWNIFVLVLMVFAVYCILITNKDSAAGKEAPLGGAFVFCAIIGVFFLYRFMPIVGFEALGFLDMCLLSLAISAVWWVCCFVWYSFIKK